MSTNVSLKNGRYGVDEERQQLLAYVAGLYYEEGLSQQEISRTVKLSRSAVSRLLAEAREAGVVEIQVHHPLLRAHSAEEALHHLFPSLSTVQIFRCTSLNYSQTLRHLGAQAAQFVQGLIGNRTILGVSWGTAVYEVVNALRAPMHYPDLTVVQLIGALNTTNPQIDGPELARRLAQNHGGKYQLLPAPLIVDSKSTRDALLNERHVRQVLERAQLSDVAIVGIGSVDPQVSSLVRAGYLTPHELDQIAARNAVGDVCGIHFDINGDIADVPINQRVVGIQVEDLKRIPMVVGVASGSSKTKPIVGALRAGLVNVLFTDEATAQEVASLASQ